MLEGGGRAFFYKIFKQLFSRDIIPILYYRMTLDFVKCKRRALQILIKVICTTQSLDFEELSWIQAKYLPLHTVQVIIGGKRLANRQSISSDKVSSKIYFNILKE